MPPPRLSDEYYEEERKRYEEKEWETFRREAAKDILCSFQPYTHDRDIEDHMVSTAVRLADKLIAKLMDNNNVQA